jgi:predicted phage terminase large subunit-like protein
LRAEKNRRELERVRRDADLIRERCKSFAGFVREAWHVLEPQTPLIWGWHLDAMCEHLEAITWGKMEPRLVCNVPPGSSKSTIFSVMWQAWEWGPCGLSAMRYLTTSFELGNVYRDTRKTRDLILSEWYRTLWPEVFDENGQLTRAGETSFANRHTGSREGVAFVALTAKRGDRLGIDDPHSLDGAESEVERDKATRRFIEGGQNRLNDQTKSAIFIVMQRLHERDLTGVVLARDLGFVHLMIPMEFEPERTFMTPIGWQDPRTYDGELLDPRRFPRLAVDRLKEDNDYAYAGQYQQRPAPREGGLFKVDKIEIVDVAPAGGHPVRGWDLAGTKRKKSPYSVGAKMKRVRGIVYVLDVQRKRTSPHELEDMIETTGHSDGIGVLQDLPQDPGQAALAQKMRIAELLAGLNFRVTPETGDKESRAGPFASQVEAGMVKLVKGPWNEPYKEELRGFPSGTYKDQVDASSRAFAAILRLDRMEDVVPVGAILLEPTDFSSA